MHIGGGKSFRQQRHRYHRVPNDNLRQDAIRSQKLQQETNEQNSCERVQVGYDRPQYPIRDIWTSVCNTRL